jgi:hypothetical protein
LVDCFPFLCHSIKLWVLHRFPLPCLFIPQVRKLDLSLAVLQ